MAAGRREIRRGDTTSLQTLLQIIGTIGQNASKFFAGEAIMSLWM
jgi:hypothetical protein